MGVFCVPHARNTLVFRANRTDVRLARRSQTILLDKKREAIMGKILDKEKSFSVSYALLMESWRRSLRAANKAPRTIYGYTEVARKLR